MRKIMKNVLVATLVAGLCLSIMGVATAEEPTIGEITVSPEEPTRESEVTFTVDITGDNIEEVRLVYKECNDAFCHSKENISMTNESGTWTAITTLGWDDTTYCDCWPVIKFTNGTWREFDEYTKEFDILADTGNGDTNGGDTTNGDGDIGGGTPGFELILVMISIVVALSIYKRKKRN